MKYAWIDTQRKLFPLPAMCTTLAVSHSGYRAWKRGGRPDRKRLTEAQILALIQSIDKELKGAYGSPRMVRELRARGFPASKTRVERIMRVHGIRARHKRRYKATTDSRHALPIAENVLARDFAPQAPNQAWSSDITYIWTDEGWLYLAVVLDLFNREVIGWSIKPRMTADIVTDALTMAWFRRKPLPGIDSSFGPGESVRERGVPGQAHRVRHDLFDYIEVFYNRSRRHSTLGYNSPVQFLQDWIASEHEQKMAA